MSAVRETSVDAPSRGATAGNGLDDAPPPLQGKTLERLGDWRHEPRFESRAFADATVMEAVVPPVRVAQDVAMGGRHRYHLVLHLEGHGRYACAGREFDQAPGDVVLLDSVEPCEVVHPAGARVLRWSLPEEMLAPVLPPSFRWPTHHFFARDGLNAVLARHARDLAHEAERLDLDAKRGLLAHLCGLVGLTIEASVKPRPERRRNYRTHLRRRILAYIETHLRDPDLTARRAAEDLGISRRWLHMLLGDAAIGFADLVARRRLEKSSDLLRDPASDPLSIAEIAFHSGFNDLSTFYRRFRDRYGMTPREARRLRGTGRT